MHATAESFPRSQRQRVRRAMSTAKVTPPNSRPNCPPCCWDGFLCPPACYACPRRHSATPFEVINFGIEPLQAQLKPVKRVPKFLVGREGQSLMLSLDAYRSRRLTQHNAANQPTGQAQWRSRPPIRWTHVGLVRPPMPHPYHVNFPVGNSSPVSYNRRLEESPQVFLHSVEIQTC